MSLVEQENVSQVTMSNLNGQGVVDVKTSACDLLLTYRLQQKADIVAGGNANLKREEDYLRGPHVAQPKKRDNKVRAAYMPDNFTAAASQKVVTLKEVQEEHGGAGVFTFPLQEHYMLEKTEWKYDIRPEFMDGKNIADYVDADILAKLEQLEQEEEQMENILDNNEDMESEVDEDYEEALREVKGKRSMLKMQHKMNRNKNAYPRGKDTLDEVTANMESKGIETEKLTKRVKGKIDQAQEKTRKNRLERDMDDMELDSADDTNEQKITKKVRSISRSRSRGYVREVSAHDQKLEKVR